METGKFKIPLRPITYHLSPGFTLIELMVVVTIMIVLIVAALPTLREFSHGRRLQAGGNVVTAALRKTRTEAISKRKKHRSIIDTTTHAVAIYDNDDNLVGNWEKLPDFVICDPNLSSFSGDDGRYYYIEFKSDGGLSGGFASKEICLKEESTNDSRTININALTGRIE